MTVTYARCGRRLRNGDWVYSRHTGKRYCPPREMARCDKLARRRRAA